MNGDWVSGWAQLPQSSCHEASMTFPPPIRGSERRPSGEPWMASDARGRRACHPALRPTPSWDIPARPTNRPNYYSDSAQAAGASSRDPRARARGRTRPGGVRRLPNAPKWDIAVRPRSDPYRSPFAVCGWRAPPLQGSGSLAVDGAGPLGGGLFYCLPLRAGLGLPPVSIGLGGPVLERPCPPHCLMARSGPCMDTALQRPSSLRKRRPIRTLRWERTKPRGLSVRMKIYCPVVDIPIRVYAPATQVLCPRTTGPSPLLIRKITTTTLHRPGKASPNLVVDITIVHPSRPQGLLLAFAPRPLLRHRVAVGTANGINGE